MIHFVYLCFIGAIVFGALALILQQRRDYDALDQGFSEVTDAYQTDMLQYEDTINKKNDELHRAHNDLHTANVRNEQLGEQRQALKETHRQQSKKDHGLIAFYQDKLTEATAAGLELQKTVTFHNEQCLPLQAVVNEIFEDPFTKELETGTATIFDGE